MPTRETTGDQTLIKDDDGNIIHTIDRVFENGVMEIWRNGEKVREMTAEQVQAQIDRMNTTIPNFQQRVTDMQEMVTHLQGWKDRI